MSKEQLRFIILFLQQRSNFHQSHALMHIITVFSSSQWHLNTLFNQTFRTLMLQSTLGLLVQGIHQSKNHSAYSTLGMY